MAPEQGGILDKEPASPPSGSLGAGADKDEGRGRRLLRERSRLLRKLPQRRGRSSVQVATPEKSPTARSSRRPAQLRHSDVGEGSHGLFPGGNNGAYQGPPGWFPWSPWFPQGFQPIAPNVAMMNPSGSAPEGFQPAQIPEASKHNSEADVEEVAAPPARTGKRTSKNSGTRTKLSNFNADEDINLVKSWFEISCDPVTSIIQKRERIWDRILQRYNFRRASDPERTIRSLQSRWYIINTEVGLFASIHADSIRENPSGMSDASKTTHAVSNFASVHKRKFGFLHCWEIMKDEPKWQDPNVRDIATAGQGEGFGNESTQGPDTVDNADGQSSPVRSGAQVRRPMGRDSAKSTKKKANSDASSTSPAQSVSMIHCGSAPECFQPAQIPEASKHNSEANMEEVAAPPARTGKRTSKNSGTRTKLSNFNADEDINLVKSWLEINCDPMTSTAQKGKRMWDRILQRYNFRRASDPERTIRSLQSRWDRINAEVGMFASIHADSSRENPGMSDACKITHAVSKFASVHKQRFGFLHCWDLMKDAPKWQDPNVRDIATAAQGEGFGDESTQGPDTVDNADGQSSPDPNVRDIATAAQGEGFGDKTTQGPDTVNNADGQSSPVRSGAQARRPMGRDSAKAAKKKANSDAGSTSSAEYAARMQDHSLQKISIMQEEAVRENDRFQQLASIDERCFEEMRRYNESLIQIELEKIRLMREKQEDERLKEEKKEDERILKVDLDACTPSLRLYYQTLQEEILEKIAARRRRSQAP